MVGLLGESGSGKSTLGMAICGTLPTNAAEVEGYIQWDRERRAAVIPQSPSLTFSPFLRCGAQVADILSARGASRSEARRRTAELFREAGLAEDRCAVEAYPHELSGGELQRVAVARALAMQPWLLVADEACSALDLLQAIRVQNTLDAIRRVRGLSILWITHDPRELVGFANRVVVLEQGRVVDTVSAGALARGEVEAGTRRYLDAMPGGWRARRTGGAEAGADGWATRQ